MGQPGLVVCRFLVPLVRDSDRAPHQALLWRLLQDALCEAFGGRTGPRPVLFTRDPKPVPGAWRPEGSQEEDVDESREYEVDVLDTRVDDLRTLLRKVANSFDQRSIRLVVGVTPEYVTATDHDGYLE